MAGSVGDWEGAGLKIVDKDMAFSVFCPLSQRPEIRVACEHVQAESQVSSASF